MPNPARYTAIDPLPARTLVRLPIRLQIQTPINYRAEIFRLLLGTLDIECHFSNKIIRQRVNYSKLSAIKNTRISLKVIKEGMPNYTLRDFDKYLSTSINNNHRFYKELFFEYCSYFYASENNKHTVGFLHLYRIIESIAYCLPLIWASRAQDYVGTFNQLKEYFNGNRTGELRVLERFINDSVNTAFLDTPVTLNITSIHLDWKQAYFRTLRSTLDAASIISEIPDDEITVKFGSLIGLAINIRNKYFHFLTGAASSFSSDEIIEPDEFFCIINKPIVNWLAFIFFEILDYEMR